MASRRQLKKELNYICGELFADCVVLKMCDTCNEDLLNQTMLEIINLRSEYVSRVSHTEKGSVKKFYAKLREEFSAKVEAISQKIVEA